MKKSELRNIIRESIKELMLTEQQNYNCSNRICSPFPPSLINHHWWNFVDSANNMQNANFADYRYEHTGNISYCQSTSGPGHQWRWFDGIKLNPNPGATINPNPIHPNWASMITYLQAQGVAVTLAMTGQQVNLAAIAALQTSGIIAWPQGACGNQPCPPPCRDHKPCPNGMVTQSDPNWGYCAECLGMQPTPSPWPNITGTQCECCDDTPVIEPCKKCCCEKNIMPMEQRDGPIGDPEPSFGGCKPGTEIMLSPTADPCKCPQGMVETPCKKL